MRTQRLSGVGLTMLLLLLGGVVACDEDDGRRVTLKVTEVLGQEAGAGVYEERHGEEIGAMSRTVVEASDPRLSGTWTIIESCRWGSRDGYDEAEHLCIGSVRVENEDGTWLGTHQGYRREGIDNLAPTILEGQGRYAGLTAVLDYRQPRGVTGDWGVSGDGYVVDFEMPDQPELFVD